MSFFGKDIPMWDAAQGLALARDMEEKLSKRFACHFALGGSVMYRGSSEKDVDLIVYPHYTLAASHQKEFIVNEIQKLGFVPADDSFGNYESSRALVTTYNGRRVDFLFVGF